MTDPDELASYLANALLVDLVISYPLLYTLTLCLSTI